MRRSEWSKSTKNETNKQREKKKTTTTKQISAEQICSSCIIFLELLLLFSHSFPIEKEMKKKTPDTHKPRRKTNGKNFSAAVAALFRLRKRKRLLWIVFENRNRNANEWKANTDSSRTFMSLSLIWHFTHNRALFLSVSSMLALDGIYYTISRSGFLYWAHRSLSRRRMHVKCYKHSKNVYNCVTICIC